MKNMTRTIRAWAVLVLCVASMTACDDAQDPSVVRRAGKPDYVRATDSQMLDRAVAKAKQTYREMVDALANPQPQHTSHAVKKPFATPSGSTEHIWINDITWDGSVFRGTVNNDPVDTQEVRMGDEVTVTPAELSDWMYIDGNRIVGGYTVRALHYQSSPEDQCAFLDQTGLIVPEVDF